MTPYNAASMFTANDSPPRATTVQKTIASVGFLLMLLALPILHLLEYGLIHLGIMPTFRMGVVGTFVTAFAAPILVAFYFSDSQIKLNGRTCTTAVFGLFGIVLFWQIAQFSKNFSSFPEETRQTYIYTSVFSLLTLSVGSLSAAALRSPHSIYKHLNSFTLAFAALVIGYLVYYNGTFLLTELSIYQDRNYGAGYLELSDSLALFFLIALSLYTSSSRKLAFFVVASCLLYFTRSRASLACFVCAFFISALLTRKAQRATFIIGFILCALLASFALVYLSANYSTGDLLENRMVGFFFRPTEDESFHARRILAQEGLTRISDVLFFGNFMNEVWNGHGKGEYIHNWFSFLENYGVFLFLAFWGVCLSVFYRLFTLINSTENKGYIEAAFSTLLFAVAIIVLARGYLWYFVWFPLGFGAVIADSERATTELRSRRFSHSPDRNDDT